MKSKKKKKDISLALYTNGNINNHKEGKCLYVNLRKLFDFII